MATLDVFGFRQQMVLQQQRNDTQQQQQLLLPPCPNAIQGLSVTTRLQLLVLDTAAAAISSCCSGRGGCCCKIKEVGTRAEQQHSCRSSNNSRDKELVLTARQTW